MAYVSPAVFWAQILGAWTHAQLVGSAVVEAVAAMKRSVELARFASRTVGFEALTPKLCCISRKFI